MGVGVVVVVIVLELTNYLTNYYQLSLYLLTCATHQHNNVGSLEGCLQFHIQGGMFKIHGLTHL